MIKGSVSGLDLPARSRYPGSSPSQSWARASSHTSRTRARDRWEVRGRPRRARHGAGGIVARPLSQAGRKDSRPLTWPEKSAEATQGATGSLTGAGWASLGWRSGKSAACHRQTTRTDSGWLLPASYQGEQQGLCSKCHSHLPSSSLGSSLAQNTQWPGWASPWGMAGRGWTVGSPPLCPWLLRTEPRALGKGPVLGRSTSRTKKSPERSVCAL